MVSKVFVPESNSLTEEAQKELAELGEETDDYVVATKAKKQQIIKDYTAVPSNNGKGVDILDENGNKTGKIKERSLVHEDGDIHGTVHIWIRRKTEKG